MAEAACLPEEALRVARLADGGDDVGTEALSGEGARPNLVADRAQRRVRFSGQNRLVDREILRVDEAAVRGYLVTGTDPQDIALDDLGNGERLFYSVAHDAGCRSDQSGESIQRTFGPYFLKDSDTSVRNKNSKEECVAPVPKCQREHTKDQENGVEDREGVPAHDARV